MMKKVLLSIVAMAACVAGANAQSLTVCDGTNTNFSLPVKNTYFDTKGSHSQMIYPASLLTELNGKNITGVTFYCSDEMHMNGGKFQISLGESENATYATATYIDGLTVAGSCAMTAYDEDFTVLFDAPYKYNGGNLVVDGLVAEAGDDGFYAWDSFWGVNQSEFCAIIRDGSMEKFLPQATFTYEDALTGVDALDSSKIVSGVRYYNVAGQQAADAFDGVNIVVVNYTDGTQSVSKIVK